MLSAKQIWNNRAKQINITWKKNKPMRIGRNWATYLFLNNNFTTIIWAFHRLLLTFFNVILWICNETSHLQYLLFSAVLSNLVLRVFFSLLCKLNETRNFRKFRYPGLNSCQLQGYHKHWFPRNPFIHLVKRGTERVKCLAQQHNAQSPLPGFEPGPLDPETSAITMRPPCLTRLGL